MADDVHLNFNSLKFLLCVDIFLSLLFLTDPGVTNAIGISYSNFVDLDGEANLPTWYSSIKLYSVTLIFAGLCWYRFGEKVETTFLYGFLAVMFLAMSLDEVSQIHEKAGLLTDVVLQGGERENTAFHKTGIWMFFIAVPVLLIMVIAVWRLSQHLKRQPAVKMLLAGIVVFIGSAGFIEIGSNFAQSEVEIKFQLWCEELGEMVGVSLILVACINLYRSRHSHAFNRLD